MKKTLFPLFFWFLIALATFGVLRKAAADPFIAAENGGVRIVVHSEKCQLKTVENLPKRATWTEKGKTTEGCAGYVQEMEVVLFYWADRTVSVLPAPVFTKVVGA